MDPTPEPLPQDRMDEYLWILRNDHLAIVNDFFFEFVEDFWLNTVENSLVWMEQGIVQEFYGTEWVEVFLEK